MVTPPEVVPDFGSRFCGGSGISPLKLARISATFRRSVWLVGLAVAECSLLLAGLSVGVTGVALCKKNAKIIRFCARNLRTKRPHIALLNLNLNFPPVFWVCLQTKYQLSTWSKSPRNLKWNHKNLQFFTKKSNRRKNWEILTLWALGIWHEWRFSFSRRRWTRCNRRKTLKCLVDWVFSAPQPPVRLGWSCSGELIFQRRFCRISQTFFWVLRKKKKTSRFPYITDSG